MRRARMKIPVLMYHEVLSGADGEENRRMTPLYIISAAQFEDQIRLLAERGYRSVFFEDVQNLKEDGKYVILTFDDGWKGNYRYALPVLKKYDFKAVFFTTVNMVGGERSMSWEELEEMAASGMSIQSHTLSHPYLHALSREDALKELYESKRHLEKRLNIEVTSMSFPHGSYSGETVRIASEAGYKFVCTSRPDRTYQGSFQGTPAVLGRITVTNRLSAERYLRLVEYDRSEFFRERFVKGAKDAFRRAIGSANYGRLYRLFFNIKTS